MLIAKGSVGRWGSLGRGGYRVHVFGGFLSPKHSSPVLCSPADMNGAAMHFDYDISASDGLKPLKLRLNLSSFKLPVLCILSLQ